MTNQESSSYREVLMLRARNAGRIEIQLLPVVTARQLRFLHSSQSGVVCPPSADAVGIAYLQLAVLLDQLVPGTTNLRRIPRLGKELLHRCPFAR